MRIYYDQDADLNDLKGSRRRLSATELYAQPEPRDSGGCGRGIGRNDNYRLAQEHGFSPVTAAEGSAQPSQRSWPRPPSLWKRS
jgi:ketol-acid reductoisomerase